MSGRSGGTHMMSSTANLTLHTNDVFKKVFKPSCTVKMDDKVNMFDDFIVFGWNKETEDVTMLQFADAITIGKAAMMAKHAFIKSLEALSEGEREEVLQYLGVS